MPNEKPKPIPYATPVPPGGLRRWLSRRAPTSGPRMIALAIMAWVGVQCVSNFSTAVSNLGLCTLVVAVILFFVEFAASLFQ